MIRQMNAGDAETVTEVHLNSFSGFFLSFLGPGFLNLYYKNVCRSSRGIALVYIDPNGKLSGFAVGAIDPSGFYSSLLKRSWLRFGLASLPAVIKRPSIALRVLRALLHPSQHRSGADSAGLFSIGVRPGLQGQGIGRDLLQAFLSEAKKRGAKRVRLTTDRLGNDSVNRFYLKAGFYVVRQYVTQEGREMNEYEIVL